MITDEQIWQIAKKYLCNVGSHYINEMAMPDDGRIEEFARELIALAQQVKPLGFKRNTKSNYLTANTAVCQFVVYNWGKRSSYGRKFYTTEAEAIEAANEDYRKRVLSCLVHGGV